MATFKEVLGTVSKGTQDVLKQKSQASFKKLGKPGAQASMEGMKLGMEVREVEEPFRKELTELAVQIFKDTYPIVTTAEIDIQAELVEPGGMSIQPQGGEREVTEEDLEIVADKLGLDKRRLINSATQGAAMVGAYAYKMFRDSLDEIDARLYYRYNKILDNSFGSHDDDAFTKMLEEMLKQDTGGLAGETEGFYDEETDKLVIKAKAINLPLLMHELVKGLYEILSLQGFSSDPEKNKGIVKQVDLPHNEPEDLQYGKYIYEALNKIVIESPYYLPVSRELFFVEVYKMSDYEFLEFIEAAIQGVFTSEQKTWIKTTLKNIYDEN